MQLSKGNKKFKLVAERNLNKYAFPIVSIKGKHIIGYPIHKKYNNVGFNCYNGIFGAKNWMLMDILGTLVIQNANKKSDFYDRIPTQNEDNVKAISSQYMSKKLIEYITDRNKNDNNDIIPESYYRTDNLWRIDEKYCRIKIPKSPNLTDSFFKKNVPFLNKYTSKKIYRLI